MISDATVQALGDVVVRGSIMHSDVTSNGRVVVAEERGAVVGGSVAAFREIVAKNIGSDFGTSTATTVGNDFLTPKRLERVERRIREHEEQLTKIGLIKKKIAESHIDVTKLPADQQDLLISVLQKEAKARQEMNGLLRGRQKFVKSMTVFLHATIRVLEQLHPGVRVRIGAAVEEFKERLERVVLSLGPDQRIHPTREE
jgi:uncharacterized protein (DUF342 family)